MNTYHTAQIAQLVRIHPNTVRLYEQWQLIPKPLRQANGYRIFTDVHLNQISLARLALQGEITQNGLRKEAVTIIKTSAAGDYPRAMRLAEGYLAHIIRERQYAKEAAEMARQLLSSPPEAAASRGLTRKQAADTLQLTIDTIRNWEMNGLLTVRRKENGYRLYNEADIRTLKIIRSLRLANYSLSAILRMTNALSGGMDINVSEILDTPQETESIVSVCDRLLTSLAQLEQDARDIILLLEEMNV
ncbi:MAG: transcriptional regulator, MerR family [Paenibacillaceae bacterium]|jgi:DNA-binding transcriptional MerR regulator|nr:transcriptional regulator, MerR family [Paenibacillaceae bacterium]